MKIERGDRIDLFSCQVQGCYLQGQDWVPHTARPGNYEVFDVVGEVVILGIRRHVTGGMDVFRCSMYRLLAVVLDHYHTKRVDHPEFTCETCGASCDAEDRVTCPACSEGNE